MRFNFKIDRQIVLHGNVTSERFLQQCVKIYMLLRSLRVIKDFDL